MNTLLNFLKSYLFFFFAILIVLVAGLATFFKPVQTALSSGIVYPLPGQTFTGQFLDLYSTFALDTGALQSSLSKNGQPLTAESISPSTLSYGAMKYSVKANFTDGDLISLDHAVYNSAIHKASVSQGELLHVGKVFAAGLPEALLNLQPPPPMPSPGFLPPFPPGQPSLPTFEPLPQDLSWRYSAKLQSISTVTQTGQSSLTRPEFEVVISDQETHATPIVFSLELSQGHVPGADSEEEAGRRNCSFGYFYDQAPVSWSELVLHPVRVEQRDGGHLVFSLKSPETRKDACFFLTLKEDSGVIQPFYSTTARVPEAMLSVPKLFDPDKDFVSELKINFVTPWFDDQGKEGKDLDKRKAMKRHLASLLQIRPEVPFDPDAMVISAYEASLPLPLGEKISYQMILKQGEDIFGQRIPEATLSLETKSLKYLGLRMKENQGTVFGKTRPPAIDLLSAHMKEANLKLCRTDLESYAKIEHLVSRTTENENVQSDVEDFLLSGIDRLPVEKCYEQKLSIATDRGRTPVDLTALILTSPATGGQATSNQQASIPNGLYFMTFGFQSERQVLPEAEIANPLFFAVVDAHISMKLSRDGKALFWVNDFETGKGVPNLKLTGARSIFTAYEAHWEPGVYQEKRTYNNPLKSTMYTTPVDLGTTDQDGFLDVNLEDQDYGNAFQSWYDDPQHRSLLVTASDGNHQSFVSSKWNSGIANWNFGFEPDQYSYVEHFPAFLSTDRKLYQKGETVHFKAIVREIGKTLTIPPRKKTFPFSLSDAEGHQIFSKDISLNEFGSFTEDLVVKLDSPVGDYYIHLADQTVSFSVQEFQKPSFKVEVSVNSPDIPKEFIENPTVSTEQESWGYRYKKYTKDITLKADVLASYYAGGPVNNANLTYTVFRQRYYEQSYWSDCYYGCYYEPSKDYVTEGTGALDSLGAAHLSIPIQYESQWDDWRYLVEVTVQDISNQKISGAGTVIAKLPSDLRQYNPNISIQMEVDAQFVKKGEEILLTLKPERKWTEASNDRYHLVITHRQFAVKHEKGVGGDLSPQSDFEDEKIEDVLVNLSKFDQTKEGFLTRKIRLSEDGEYHFRLNQAEALDASTSTMSQTVYAYEENGVTNAPVVADNKIAVLTEKTSYKLGEIARLFVRLPFSPAKALLTIEKQHVVSKELIDIVGNTIIREFPIDDTFVPNAYISVIAFKPGAKDVPDYKVGYAEVVVDKTEKKLVLENKTDAKTYNPRDTVKLEATAKDGKATPVRSELMIAVVDESLIALMGNIDLDILPKFFQKIVFQTHTALTDLAMLKPLYFARKGLVGGSGGKDGGNLIFTRTNFKNTAFYVGSLVTDGNGKASTSFVLPDNIGDFRIITIGNSKENFFGATESTISVRQEVVLEDIFPMVARAGDSMKVGATVFNNGSSAKKVGVSLDSEGLTVSDSNRQLVDLAAGERKAIFFPVSVDGKNRSSIRYTITAQDEKTLKGDRLEKEIPIAEIPLLAIRLHLQDDFEKSTARTVSLVKDLNPALSKVTLSFSTTILSGIEKTIVSLLQYPYGCIEQTISTTLPNAIVKKFKSIMDIGIDEKELKKNLDEGLRKFGKFQQDNGGFAFWEGETTVDPKITPYAIQTIWQMKDLGVDVPQSMLDKGRGYLETSVKSLSGEISQERLAQLVEEARALSELSSDVFLTARTLIANRSKELTTHQKIVYGLALAKKDPKNFAQELDDLIKSIDLGKAGDGERTIDWFWDATADKALFAQLLMLAKPGDERIVPLVKELYSFDFGSYYYSTQTKIQAFIAFAMYIEKVDQGQKKVVRLDYQLGAKKGTVHLNARQIFQKVKFNLSEVGPGESLPFSITITEGNARVFSDIMVAQVPKDPTTIQPEQSKGITVKREIFRLGKVVDTENWWDQKRDLGPVSGNTLKLGETYLVKVTLEGKDAYRQVALESYLPAGVKVLNPRFKTEQTQVEGDRYNWPFHHQEYRADRFFASANYWDQYDRKVEITYYIRPIIAGTFLEPPVSVYPMYNPAVEGHTGFGKIIIEP